MYIVLWILIYFLLLTYFISTRYQLSIDKTAYFYSIICIIVFAIYIFMNIYDSKKRENYCIDCRGMVILAPSCSSSSTEIDVTPTPTQVEDTVSVSQNNMFIKKTKGSDSLLYDFSKSGQGIYLLLGSTAKTNNTNTLYSINTKTHLYMIVVSSDSIVDNVNYYNYGVGIVPLYGKESLNFSLTNSNTSNTIISLNNTNNIDEFYWWYNKIF